jgi:diaminopimelate epimerase
LPFEVSPERLRLLCDRHEGVGSDGLLLLDGTHLRIFNPDGSEAEKSGNGIRIAARWLVDTGRAPGTSFVIHTLGGDVAVQVDGKIVTANMGRPTFREDLRDLEVDGERLAVTALSIGNPHCVVVREQLDRSDLLRLGPRIERHPAFPARTNVQLARPLGRQRVGALIWERGAGETRASGSSACAVVAACQRLNLLDAHATVEMPGGELDITLGAQGDIWMRGPVEEIARIELSPDLIARLQALP